MSEDNQIKLLRYLDGHASKPEKKEVLAWSKEKKSNAKELKLYESIIEESKSLSSYNPVDTNAEWAAFKSSIKSEERIDDIKVLNFLDGFANYEDKKQIEDWAASDEANQQDLDLFETILNESANLTEYKQVDTGSEWASFLKQTSDTSKQEVPMTAVVTPIPTTKEKVVSMAPRKSSSWFTPMAQRYAIAASFAVLIAAAFWFYNANVDPYDTYATTDTSETFDLADGSQVTLSPFSSLRFPTAKTLKSAEERRGFISGGGEFDVFSNADQPFIVEANDVMGVEVLGTVFVISKDESANYIENLEGQVRAFAMIDHNIFIDLNEGDKYSFDGKSFINMRPPEPVVDTREEMNILYVLDHLMKISDWRVISGPNIPFDEEGFIKVDLNIPYEQILQSLRNDGYLDFVELSCEGCYKVTRFVEVPEELIEQ